MERKIEFLGIDIGGAHIKIVGLDKEKKIILVKYMKFYFWKKKEKLFKFFDFVNSISSSHTKIGITLTAELCDIFETRIDGFKKIYEECRRLKNKFFFYTSSKEVFTVKSNTKKIISMNWHATGKFISKNLNDAIIIDFGSTTTDIICIKNKVIKNLGFDDFSRLKNNELIYTGLTRTPIFGITNELILDGINYPVIPEFFSSMSDVYRINKSLDKVLDIDDTADNTEKNLSKSFIRVARNFGFDFKKSDKELLKKISRKLINFQMKKISVSLDKLIIKFNMSEKVPIVICGIGKEVLRNFLKSKNIFEFEKFTNSCKKNLKIKATHHAPAYSVAFLLSSLK
tara:strand:- start:544 stop:1569 length:1026 start_codon:yes stop_codon:yes gene_type:complete